MTFWQLVTAMKEGREITINGIRGFVMRIERESGTEYCWNVHLYTRNGGSGQETFIRTID